MRRERVATPLEALGLLLISTGAALVAVPAGFIVLGLSCVLFGIALTR